MRLTEQEIIEEKKYNMIAILKGICDYDYAFNTEEAPGNNNLWSLMKMMIGEGIVYKTIYVFATEGDKLRYIKDHPNLADNR